MKRHPIPSRSVGALAAARAFALLAATACADDPLQPALDRDRAPRATTITAATAGAPDPLPTVGSDPGTMALGANAAGVIVGAAIPGTGQDAAAIWQPGGASKLPMPPGTVSSSAAFGINAHGQILGVAIVNGSWRLLLWPSANSAPADLTPQLPGNPSQIFPRAINARGQIAGTLMPSAVGWNPVCFLWTPDVPNGTTGTTTTVLDPAATICWANDMNSSGQVTGYSGTRTAQHAFLWTPAVPNGTTGTAVDLTPTDISSEGRAVNDAGQVAGHRYNSSSPPGTPTAFVWTPPSCGATVGTTVDLGDFSGVAGVATVVTDLSDAGYVVGHAGPNAYFWQDGTFTPLSAPAGATGTTPEAITSANLVVGTTYFLVPTTRPMALRWQVSPGTVAAPQAGIDRLRALVLDMRDQQRTLANGAAQSLLAKLDAAVRQLAHPCSPAPANLLRAVINEVEALVAAGRLTSAQAKPLLDGAQAAIGTL